MLKKSVKKTNKAAIYIRVSTEEQAKEGFSLAGQEQALKEHAKILGYDIYKVYKDEGKSAKDLHRPALQQMLKDAEKHYFSAIIVYKLDRFSRSLKDLILTIDKLKDMGIDFISMQDRIETASASGKLMFHIISSFAEFERDIISERTRFGMIEKAKEGGIVSKAPLGYKISNGKLLVEHEQAEKVRTIFKEYLNSEQSLNNIAKKYELTVRGLLKILQNRTYIGEIKFRNNYAGMHEAIIEKGLFEKVQEKLNQEKIKRVKKKYEKTLIMLFKDKEKIKPLLNLLLSGELTLEEKQLPEGDIK
ncbi:MAG: recombinase family protein, partial [Candidatus Woesearchaeota archaeon]